MTTFNNCADVLIETKLIDGQDKAIKKAQMVANKLRKTVYVDRVPSKGYKPESYIVWAKVDNVKSSKINGTKYRMNVGQIPEPYSTIVNPI